MVHIKEKALEKALVTWVMRILLRKWMLARVKTKEQNVMLVEKPYYVCGFNIISREHVNTLAARLLH